MPTREDLHTSITTTVNDPDITEDTERVVDLINEAYADVAARVLLPKLESSVQVTTSISATEVAQPDAMNFDRELFYCSGGEDFGEIKVLSSMALMMERYPDAGLDNVDGEVEFVCISGSNIFYHPVPETAQTLLLRFYTEVTELDDGEDIPSAIPTKFQKRLIHSYVCKELFNDIEDGLEGAKVNTDKYERRYEKALFELEAQTQHGQARAVPDRPRSSWV